MDNELEKQTPVSKFSKNISCKCDAAGHCTFHHTVSDPESHKECRGGNGPPKSDGVLPCIYLGKLNQENKWPDADHPIYECPHHGHCTRFSNRRHTGLKDCSKCSDYVNHEDSLVSDKYLDPLHITDRFRKKTDSLRGMLAGKAAFLVCGGPSLKEIDTLRLGDRGVFSLGVNNVAAYTPEGVDPLQVPPTVSAFVCSDPPQKFHSGIWEDPKIMKFVPIPKLKNNRAKLRHCHENGTYEFTGRHTYECPNVWGFDRRSWLACDDTWFSTTRAAWGNQKQGHNKLGEPRCANTTFLGLRLLQYLGCRTIFLLGVDFYMNPDAGLHENYAFGEQRDSSAVRSNNRHYEISNNWFLRLRPVFERYGFQTFNCNKHSHLRAFPYVPYERALEICKQHMPKNWDIKDWYKKDEN